MAKVSKVHSLIPARSVGALALQASDVNDGTLRELQTIGYHIRPGTLAQMMRHIYSDTMDANDEAPSPLAGLTAGSIPAPVQFLQAWLPGHVRIMTAARKIDECVGVATVGAWEDEEVVQSVLENLGAATLYSDYGNVPKSSWNVNYERRTIVRFEKGMEVGTLESLRSARVRVDNAAEKRIGATQALDIQRNKVGFLGYNGGNNRTYGFLNDPALIAAIAVPNGASASPLWSTKKATEIIADLRLAYQALRTQSQDNIDPTKASVTLVIPTQLREYLNVPTDFGYSVYEWIEKNYKGTRIESAPQLNNAVGGQNVVYLYADSVDDGSTDGGSTWIQPVPAKFFTLGTEKRSKAYMEDYSNATAGVMLKRPFAVVRLVGM